VRAFVVDLGRGGDERRRRALRSGFETRQAAEQAQAELIAEKLSGYVAPSKLTVKAYLRDRWLPRTRTSPKTLTDRQTLINAYIVPRIGSFALQELTGDHLTEMYDDLAVSGRTHPTSPRPSTPSSRTLG
jgi:hypothetical protein